MKSFEQYVLDEYERGLSINSITIGANAIYTKNRVGLSTSEKLKETKLKVLNIIKDIGK